MKKITALYCIAICNALALTIAFFLFGEGIRYLVFGISMMIIHVIEIIMITERKRLIK